MYGPQYCTWLIRYWCYNTPSRTGIVTSTFGTMDFHCVVPVSRDRFGVHTEELRECRRDCLTARTLTPSIQRHMIINISTPCCRCHFLILDSEENPGVPGGSGFDTRPSPHAKNYFVIPTARVLREDHPIVPPQGDSQGSGFPGFRSFFKSPAAI